MAFQIVQNPDGTAKIAADSYSPSQLGAICVEFAPGVDVELGRGTTDTDRTYVGLRRSDGSKVYLFVDTGTTLTVSATKP